MIQHNKTALLWLSVGLLFSLLVLLVIYEGLAGKVWVTNPEEIPDTANAVMNSVQTGDWYTLEDIVWGNARLSPEIGETGSAEEIIYTAYRKSLLWTCDESFDIRNEYVTQKITVTCLDIPAVTEAITGILSESVLNTEEYPVLLSAAEEVLKSDPPMKQHEISLTFLCENGQWLLVPNNALLALLSGFTAL